jgi:tRNA threonylcarbamoyladenosine biosynthesis protein TsaB
MLLLTLDAALARVSAAVVEDERVLAADVRDVTRGIKSLPCMAASVLAEAGVCPAGLDVIAVTLGPGSFTGIRGALSLAHGIGLAASVDVIGVTIPEAVAASLGAVSGRRLWVAIDGGRERVFLDIGGEIEAVMLDALPPPGGAIALAGDAAATVAARLAARGADAVTTDVRWPEPLGIARAARDRLSGALPPRPAQPLYVDPPRASLPRGGLRPAPAG